MWRISFFQLGLGGFLLVSSCILIVRRRNEAQAGLVIPSVRNGGSPLWFWAVIAIWAGLSLLAATALLVTGQAVFDY